ncbi:MAG: phenylalanine--tRNA ligase subunit beta [bacterium]|nr:phenylalanine--tRNA ligase subunit beta [bacterium]
MRYSYKLISEYIDGEISPDKLIYYLEILGLNPLEIERSEDDVIFELETPANRGDLLSLIGIAREIVPFTDSSIKIPHSIFEETSKKSIPVKIESENDCFYYSCRVIENVSVKQTDKTLKDKIEKLGYRTCFNVVDISNYVMAETGQPLHIFDLDKIEGNIEIRRARKDEYLVTIDGKKRTLDENILVIADSHKVIAIAGIMGGQNSEVNINTKNILIESALFSPVVVRRGSKRMGLITEASARFERGISKDICKMGMSRATFLIKKICKGNIGPLSESSDKKISLPDIKFDMEKMNKLAGIEIEENFVIDLLTSLGFKYKKDKKFFVVNPPSFRNDIKEDIDIIEDVIKYKRFETFPSRIPYASIQATSSSPEIEKLEKIRDICIHLGFTEVIHMGLTSKENIELSEKVTPVEIENPISSNLKFLRTSLIPEMLETIKFNIYHGAESFNLFEIGKIYYKKESSFKEELRIAFISVNSGDFFTLKGKLEKFLNKLHINNIEFKREEGLFSIENNLEIYLDGISIGNLFILSDKLRDKFDLKNEVYGGEINLESIMGKVCFKTFFKEPARYPSSRRDFSFIFHKDIEWKEIENTILSLNLPVEKIEFFDLYRDNNMSKDSISISFSVFFRSATETLANEDIVNFSRKIIENISLKLKGQLRGAGGET